jgi:hypothetical protein
MSHNRPPLFPDSVTVSSQPLSLTGLRKGPYSYLMPFYTGEIIPRSKYRFDYVDASVSLFLFLLAENDSSLDMPHLRNTIGNGEAARTTAFTMGRDGW